MANKTPVEYLVDVPNDVFPSNDYSEFVEGLFTQTGDHSKQVAHAFLGVLTEIHELSRATSDEELLDEGGDLLFYLTALGISCRDFLTEGYDLTSDEVPEELQLKVASILEDPQLDAVGSEYEEAFAEGDNFQKFLKDTEAQVLDEIKKWVGYGKAPKNPFLMSARVTMLSAQALYDAYVQLHHKDYQAMIEEMVRRNMAKLTKRYDGTKFDVDKAMNKDKAAEAEAVRKEMEQ